MLCITLPEVTERKTKYKSRLKNMAIGPSFLTQNIWSDFEGSGVGNGVLFSLKKGYVSASLFLFLWTSFTKMAS